MNDATREFLELCKEAGYEFVTINMKDARVPASTQLKNAEYSGVFGSGGSYHFVAAHPPKRDTGRPAIWDICRAHPCTAGLLWRGLGCGEAYSLPAGAGFDAGCYDLSEVFPK